MTEFQMGKREKGFRSLRWLPWGLLIFCLTLSGCGPSWEKEEAETGFFAMNTLMTFTAYGENAQEALSEARAQVERAEGLWSVTDENSEIWQANHSGGKAMPVSEETARLVSFALGMAQETDGALDCTLGKISRHRKSPSAPSSISRSLCRTTGSFLPRYAFR